MSKEMTNCGNDCINIVYEHRWEWFKPPFRWYFRWAYKIKEINKNGECISKTHGQFIKQVQRGGNNQTQIGIVNNYSKDNKNTITIPCKVSDLIDKIFSHNEIIALWYDDPENNNYSIRQWKGMAWNIPQELGDQEFIRIFGAIQDSIVNSDIINIQVKKSNNINIDKILKEEKEKNAM